MPVPHLQRHDIRMSSKRNSNSLYRGRGDIKWSRMRPQMN